MRDDRIILQDMLAAIANVQRYASLGRGRFDSDELIQVWIIHHLQIVGEAARSLSDELRQEHPEVPWRQIQAMRNILVHVYFGVDLDEVWAAVARDIPVLTTRIEAILNQLPPQP